ncbi:MAG TPA: serine/threonine-protein kinase [Polyangia bacterium]|nr:serine/threonine-protein kinase [Polyangia bacterium]
MSLINTTVGNYRVTKLLGEGGMGAVYLGEHPVIGRKVAIKVLHTALAADKDIVARFFNEARAIHLIAAPNIVEILDFGQTPDGQPYFIMEYLTGEALSEIVARGPIAPAEVASLADQMCRALGAAHAKGIVHRDLKPHNVQIIEKDGQPFVKILDFGVAKILAAPDGSQSVKTRTGSLMGTPLYMSPEQCKGAGLLDHRTDIYSLGVMIFEMLAGRPPFMAEGIGELFAKHMLEEAPSLLELAPQTPPAMAAAVMKSLNKELDDRFPSMEDFRKSLLGEVAITGAAPKPAAKRPGSIGAATRSLAPTQTMSPQAQSTTLSSASSEIDDELAKPKRKTGVIVGVVGGLAAAAVVAVLVLSKSGNSGSTDAPKSTSASTAAMPAPVVPPAPPPKTTVTVRFEAIPAGAHVVRKSDGHDLGASPLDVKLAHNGPGTDYVVKKDGYKDFAVTADLSEDNTVHVALEKIEAPPAPTAAKVEPEKKKQSSGGHRPAKRHGGAVPDEDGLATPSF